MTLEQRVEALEADQTVRVANAGGGTINALLMVSQTGDHATPSPTRQYRFKVPTGSGYETPPTVTAPTLAIDGGTAFPIYDNLFNLIAPAQLTPGNFIEVQYSAALGGVWVVVEPRKFNTANNVVQPLVDSNTGTGAAYVAQSTGLGLVLDSSFGGTKRLLMRFGRTNTSSTPTLAVDGNSPVPILSYNATAIEIGSLVPGADYWLRFNWAGGSPYFSIQLPLAAEAAINSYSARQEAGAAQRGIQQLWHVLEGPAFDAIPRSTILDETFDSDANASKYRWAEGAGAVPTYAEYQWVDDGGGTGHIEADLSDGGGLWWDPNHVYPGPGFLQLLWVAHTSSFGAPIPPIANLTNAILELEIRLRDFTLPAKARLALLSQFTNGGLAYNYVHLSDEGRLVDDIAGFGGFGFGFPPKESLLSDSGLVPLSFKFPANDSFVRPIGWSTARAADYGASPIGEAMTCNLDDFILVALFPQQANPTTPPLDKVAGTLEIHSVRLRVPT